MRCCLSVTIALALAAAVPAAAAQDAWYAGVALGNGNTELDEGVVAAAGGGGAIAARDDRDPAYKVLLGYRLNDWLAVEGGYVHLGEFRVTRETAAGAINADVRLKGLAVDAVATWPLRRGFALSATLGTLLSESKVFIASSGTAVPATGTGSRVDDEANLHYGLGLRYALDARKTLRVDWDRYDGIGKAAPADVNLYTVGIEFRF